MAFEYKRLDPPLMTSAPPPPSDLVNSLVHVPGSRWTLLLTTLPSNGMALDVDASLKTCSKDDPPVMTSEMCGQVFFPGQRILASAGICLEMNQGEIWCFANGKRILVHNLTRRIRFEVVLRYECRAISLGKTVDGLVLMACGGPRGVVIQRLNHKGADQPEFVCFMWRRHGIRLVKFSPSGKYLLVVAVTGHVGLWRTSAGEGFLKDEAVPLYSCELLSATCCAVEFSPTENLFVISSWNEKKDERPYHFVFAIENSRVSRLDQLKFLGTKDTTSRSSVFLSPPALAVFSPDGRCLISSSSPSSINVWDVLRGQSVAKFDFDDKDDEIVGIAFVKTIVLVVRFSSGKVSMVAIASFERDSGMTVGSLEGQLVMPTKTRQILRENSTTESEVAEGLVLDRLSTSASYRGWVIEAAHDALEKSHLYLVKEDISGSDEVIRLPKVPISVYNPNGKWLRYIGKILGIDGDKGLACNTVDGVFIHVPFADRSV